MTLDPIRIDGLRDFQRALKDMDGESQKALRVVHNKAAEVVAGGARRLVRSSSGRARGSVRATSSQRLSRVSGGGGRAPYYPWLDFGGAVGEGRRIRRPFLKSGRYIYATFDQRRPWVLDQLERGLTKLAKDSGMEIG